MKTLRVLKEVFLSSLPLAAVMIIVCGFVAPMPNPFDYVKLTIGYLCVIFGQTLFLVGIDSSILPIGKLVGQSLIKFKKAAFVIIFGFLFGLLATVAEPALAVLARQAHMILPAINATLFVWLLGTGIGVFVGLALFRIIKDINIKILLAVSYIVLFIVVIFVPEQFVALAFDGSGATTGDVSVPFILALGMGASATLSKHKTNDDTFGIIGIASIGPIFAVFIYGIILKAVSGGVLPESGVYQPGAAEGIGSILLGNFGDVALALLPVILVFIPFQFFLFKLPRKEFIKILLGAVPVYIGLLIFLSGIDFGFAFAGKYIGEVFLDAARPEWFRWLLLLIGFILGAAITLSEPAVTVLGEQLETITNGHIRKMTIRMTLAAGIGVASVLAIIKILTQVNILWFLIPLYAVALIMMKFTPKLFVGLAFDSGGVTGGALTSAFLTPLTLGIAQAVSEQSVLTNGFGIIAFISVTPLLAVQMLGLVYERRLKKVQKKHPSVPAYNVAEANMFLVLIAARKQSDELLSALSESGALLTHSAYGRGTARAGYLGNLFGLIPEENKVVITAILPESKSDAVFGMLTGQFEFSQPNTGIAFTIPIDGAPQKKEPVPANGVKRRPRSSLLRKKDPKPSGGVKRKPQSGKKKEVEKPSQDIGG